MRRDSRGSMSYWNKWITFAESSIEDSWVRLKDTQSDPSYRPQYAFELAKAHYELMIRRYSRGDAVADLGRHFDGLLNAWEEAERLGKEVWSPEVQFTRHSWKVNLDHYIRCFWLTGLAFALQIPDAQWQRLLFLMGNDGEDALLDRVIAYRQPERKIGQNLCFPKAYKRLYDVLDAPDDQRSVKLRSYMEHWFIGLKNAGSSSFPLEFRTPSWWGFCADEALGMRGAYFGCWSIEAVAVAIAIGVNDTSCLDHPNYPGDLLEDHRSPRYIEVESLPVLPERKSPSPSRGWLARLLRR